MSVIPREQYFQKKTREMAERKTLLLPARPTQPAATDLVSARVTRSMMHEGQRSAYGSVMPKKKTEAEDLQNESWSVYEDSERRNKALFKVEEEKKGFVGSTATWPARTSRCS